MRPSWDEYFIQLADFVAKRSTCIRRHVGAVIVKDKQVLATGYNGPPKGTKHCLDRGSCIRNELQIASGQYLELCYASHAEMSAIAQAAKIGIPLKDSILYCNTFPCSVCMKLIINSDIKEIHYIHDYNDDISKKLALESSINLVKFKI